MMSLIFPRIVKPTRLFVAFFGHPSLNPSPKVELSMEMDNYLVKTATTRTEVLQSLKLRYDVFHKEYRGKKFPIGLDLDRYDRRADLLIVIDKNTDKVVGTYRLICSEFSDVFYSHSEFAIGDFLKQPGVKLELSRACIHPNYRTGAIMNLLWRGMAAYMNSVDAQYLFGCSSVQTMDSDTTGVILQYFRKKGYLNEEFSISPHKEYQFEINEPEESESSNPKQGKGLISPLLLSYFRAGAKVYGKPALDRNFRCVDFFTILDLNNLARGHRRKFVSPSQNL